MGISHSCQFSAWQCKHLCWAHLPCSCLSQLCLLMVILTWTQCQSKGDCPAQAWGVTVMGKGRVLQPVAGLRLSSLRLWGVDPPNASRFTPAEGNRGQQPWGWVCPSWVSEALIAYSGAEPGELGPPERGLFGKMSAHRCVSKQHLLLLAGSKRGFAVCSDLHPRPGWAALREVGLTDGG